MTPEVSGYPGPHPNYLIEPLMLGARIIKTVDAFFYSQFWDYDDHDKATAALEEWKASGFVGEPDGWVRTMSADGFYYRRRPNGDKSAEYLDPRYFTNEQTNS